MRHLKIIALAVGLGLATPAISQEHQHTAVMDHTSGSAARGLPREMGQSAFAAMGEIAERLEADPDTDWSKVDMDGLRRHLVEMDDVMLRAKAVATPVPGGARFLVSGDSPSVRQAIQDMVGMHTSMLNGDHGRHETWEMTATGARWTVTAADPHGEAEIRGLGFFGLLASGNHHQRHHLMMATGAMQHG